MADPSGSGTGEPTIPADPSDLFGTGGGSSGTRGLPPDDFEPAGSGRGKKWAIVGLVVIALVSIVGYYGLGSLKGAAPKAPVAAAPPAPAADDGDSAVAQGDPAVPAPTAPAAPKAVPATTEVVLNCTYAANAAVMCSGTLPQPLDEVVEWLPGEEQEPAPAPAKARLTIKTSDGREYIAANVVEIAEAQEGSLGSLKFVLAAQQ